jgi:hypothetical protein
MYTQADIDAFLADMNRHPCGRLDCLRCNPPRPDSVVDGIRPHRPMTSAERDLAGRYAYKEVTVEVDLVHPFVD